MIEQTTHGRDLAVDRPHPARPLHRGHLPDLRLRQRPRRPVRQLRQPARPDRPDQPAQPDQRRDAGVRRDRALLPRPAGAGRGAGRVARRARGVGPGGPTCSSSRQNLLDDIRPRAMTRDIDWGIPVPLPGWRGQPEQAALRVVRRGHRLPVGVDRVGPAHRRPGGVAPVVERPARPGRTTSWARTTSPSTPRSGRPSCSPTTARATRAASPGAFGELQPADRGGLQRVPDHGGPQVLLVAAGRHLRARLPVALRAGRAALLHRRRRAGEPGHRLHLGGVRAAQQRRAGRRLGQPGQPHAISMAQELRRDPGGRRADRRRTEALLATVDGGVRARSAT